MNKKKRGPVKLLWKLTPLVIKAAPGAFLLTTVMAVFHGVSWGAVTAGQQIFFDGVTEFATGKASLKRVLAAFFLLGIAYVLCHIFNGAGNYLNEMMEKKAEGRLSFFIHEKMAAMKPIYFEEPDKLDIFNKAEEGKNNAVELVSALQGVFTFYLPYFLFYGMVSLSFKAGACRRCRAGFHSHRTDTDRTDKSLRKAGGGIGVSQAGEYLL